MANSDDREKNDGIKIYVLHYSKLVDRKANILQQFNAQGITNYEFIEKYDKDEITDAQRNIFDINYRPMSFMSLHLKHIYAYKLVAENDERALILEDDVILCERFIEKLNNYMTQLPEIFDMVFIGDGCHFHIEPHKLIPNKNIYEKGLYPTSWGGDGVSRCSDSYLISKKCAITLCDYLKKSDKITLPPDWWINIAARDNDFKVYWAEPTITTQGTQTGLFKSSI